MDTKVYACYNKNDEIRAKSSSGGIYYLLARDILCKGGVVFAACYDGINVKHKKVDNENALIESLGSKYMPSDLGNTFVDIKNELYMGKSVLFAGIPCQCAGLLSYLQGCVNIANLITVDVICHGVPSKKSWKSYCNSLKNTGFNLTYVNMRDKSSGWKNYSWKLIDSEEKSKLQSHDDNLYMRGFIANLYLRPSCSNCKFKGVERKTDITLGDYWGIENVQPDMDDDKGTSLVFVHSEVGQKLFEDVSSFVVRTSAIVELAIKNNPSAVTSSVVSDKRNSFFQRLSEGEDFCGIIRDLTRKPLIIQVKRKAKNMIRKFVGGGK